MFAHVGSSGENRKSIVRQPTVRAVPEKKSIAVARQKIRAPISQDPFLLPGKRGQKVIVEGQWTKADSTSPCHLDSSWVPSQCRCCYRSRPCFHLCCSCRRSSLKSCQHLLH